MIINSFLVESCIMLVQDQIRIQNQKHVTYLLHVQIQSCSCSSQVVRPGFQLATKEVKPEKTGACRRQMAHDMESCWLELDEERSPISKP